MRIHKKYSDIGAMRMITQDGRYLDKDGYLMTKKEIQLMQKENKEIQNDGGLVFNYITYAEPKKSVKACQPERRGY